MKYVIITAIVLIGGFAVAHADFYPTNKAFNVANVRVVRFTDPDTSDNCYIVLSSAAEAMNSISCVTGHAK